MSELSSTIVPKNGHAVATILIRLTKADEDILARVGEPTVEFGGSFTSATIGGTHTIASNSRSVVNSLQVSVKFDVDSQDTAGNVAIGQEWVTDVTSKVSTALAAARTEDAGLATNASPVLVSYSDV